MARTSGPPVRLVPIDGPASLLPPKRPPLPPPADRPPPPRPPHHTTQILECASALAQPPEGAAGVGVLLRIWAPDPKHSERLTTRSLPFLYLGASDEGAEAIVPHLTAPADLFPPASDASPLTALQDGLGRALLVDCHGDGAGAAPPPPGDRAVAGLLLPLMPGASGPEQRGLDHPPCAVLEARPSRPLPVPTAARVSELLGVACARADLRAPGPDSIVLLPEDIVMAPRHGEPDDRIVDGATPTAAVDAALPHLSHVSVPEPGAGAGGSLAPATPAYELAACGSAGPGGSGGASGGGPRPARDDIIAMTSAAAEARVSLEPSDPSERSDEEGCPEAEAGSRSGGGGTIPPSGEAAGLHRLTLDDLRGQFGNGVKEAARNLGVCVTTLKRSCRRLGIRRWPRRQLVKLQRALHEVGTVGDRIVQTRDLCGIDAVGVAVAHQKEGWAAAEAGLVARRADGVASPRARPGSSHVPGHGLASPREAGGLLARQVRPPPSAARRTSGAPALCANIAAQLRPHPIVYPYSCNAEDDRGAHPGSGELDRLPAGPSQEVTPELAQRLPVEASEVAGVAVRARGGEGSNCGQPGADPLASPPPSSSPRESPALASRAKPVRSAGGQRAAPPPVWDSTGVPPPRRGGAAAPPHVAGSSRLSRGAIRGPGRRDSGLSPRSSSRRAADGPYAASGSQESLGRSHPDEEETTEEGRDAAMGSDEDTTRPAGPVAAPLAPKGGRPRAHSPSSLLSHAPPPLLNHQPTYSRPVSRSDAPTPGQSLLSWPTAATPPPHLVAGSPTGLTSVAMHPPPSPSYFTEVCATSPEQDASLWSVAAAAFGFTPPRRRRDPAFGADPVDDPEPMIDDASGERGPRRGPTRGPRVAPSSWAADTGVGLGLSFQGGGSAGGGNGLGSLDTHGTTRFCSPSAHGGTSLDHFDFDGVCADSPLPGFGHRIPAHALVPWPQLANHDC